MGDGHENDIGMHPGSAFVRVRDGKRPAIDLIKSAVSSLTYAEMMELSDQFRLAGLNPYGGAEAVAKILSRWATEKPMPAGPDFGTIGAPPPSHVA